MEIPAGVSFFYANNEPKSALARDLGDCRDNKEVYDMAAKTANVTARIQPNIKEQAEAILDRLGIPVSVFIDMTYRQVIMQGGVPFSLEIPDKLVTRDVLTRISKNSPTSIGGEMNCYLLHSAIVGM